MKNQIEVDPATSVPRDISEFDAGTLFRIVAHADNDTESYFGRIGIRSEIEYAVLLADGVLLDVGEIDLYGVPLAAGDSVTVRVPRAH